MTIFLLILPFSLYQLGSHWPIPKMCNSLGVVYLLESSSGNIALVKMAKFCQWICMNKLPGGYFYFHWRIWYVLSFIAEKLRIFFQHYRWRIIWPRIYQICGYDSLISVLITIIDHFSELCWRCFRRFQWDSKRMRTLYFFWSCFLCLRFKSTIISM